MIPHAPHRPVIVATPLGEESDASVAAGLRLAHLLDRPAILLHADTPPPILLGAPGGGFVPDAALLDRQRDELAAALGAQAHCASAVLTGALAIQQGGALAALAFFALGSIVTLAIAPVLILESQRRSS